MVTIPQLWLPILLSAVIVFFASWFIHMLLPLHRKDFAPVPSESEAQEALRKFQIPPGDYMMPYCENPQHMKNPEMMEKFKRGPVLVMTVVKSGAMNMGGRLLQWFIYLIVVSVFAAYIASRAVPAGAPYLQVFRFAGATAFIAYSLGLWQDSIWYKRKWSTTIQNTIDGLVYGMLTAGVFGWLWPR